MGPLDLGRLGEYNPRMAKRKTTKRKNKTQRAPPLVAPAVIRGGPYYCAHGHKHADLKSLADCVAVGGELGAHIWTY